MCARSDGNFFAATSSKESPAGLELRKAHVLRYVISIKEKEKKKARLFTTACLCFQDDHRGFRRQLEDKRPIVENSLLSGRQYIANEPPLSDTSDSEGEFMTPSPYSGERFSLLGLHPDKVSLSIINFVNSRNSQFGGFQEFSLRKFQEFKFFFFRSITVFRYALPL